MSLSISVAMCTFNGARFLPQQLESIAAQSRPPDEMVICDDASSDDSEEMLYDFARCAEFPVRLARNDKTLGSTKNFEKAISLCQSTIVALADQDDVWFRSKLEDIERAFLKSEEIVAVFSDAELIDDRSQPLQMRLWESLGFNPDEQKYFANGGALNVLVRHPVVTGACMAFRREYFDLLTPIPPILVHDRWISFLLAACGKVEPIPDALIQYRRHSSQQVGPGKLETRRWSQRVASAARRMPSFYLQEIERFRHLSQILEARRAMFPFADCALKEITKKISHFESRVQLPRSRVERVPAILRELLTGGYRRYSQGLTSAAADLVV